jgi:glutathione S-transferase
MVTLYQLPTWPDHPNPSPFCVKLATYFRMAGVEYRAQAIDRSSLRRAPKGKVPFIDEGGRILCDSQLIVERYERERAVDAGLSRAEHARAHLIRRTFEEGLYFVSIYSRFFEDANFEVLKQLFAPLAPAPLLPILAFMLRRNMKRELYFQGTGRHSRDEIYAIGRADVDALVELLGDQPFFLGERPRTVDAVAYGFLVNGLYWRFSSPLAEHLRAQPSLVAYVDRMRERYWGADHRQPTVASSGQSTAYTQ